MPYVNDSNVMTPDNRTVIWRYMDFTKYVDMLDSHTLYFTLANNLKDPYEGSLYPFLSKRLRQSCENGDPIRKDLKAVLSLSPKTFFVNCWHINKTESAALWKIYLKSNEGIAIKTTVSLLKKAVSNCSKSVLIGKVIYGHENVKGISKKDNIENSPVKIGGKQYSLFHAALAKRECFQYENELRAIIAVQELTDNTVFHDGVGVKVPVDINTLINEVYISPEAPPWIKNLVERISVRYELRAKITPSDIYNNPL